MTIRSAALWLALGAAFSGPAPGAAPQEVDVDGEWELVTKASQNEVRWIVVFKRSGEDLEVKNLEVTMTGPLGKETKGAGKDPGDGYRMDRPATDAPGRDDPRLQGHGRRRRDGRRGEPRAPAQLRLGSQADGQTRRRLKPWTVP